MASKQNFLTLLGIAFVVAIIATGLFYGLVVGRLGDSAEKQAASIVVAARDLEAGTRIGPGDVELAPKENANALANGFEEPGEVTGLVVLRPTAAGEALEREAVAAGGSSRGGAAGVAPGYRAVSIHVSDSEGVVSLLQPGHRVDAQFVYRSGSATGLRTALQNLEVLRVGTAAADARNRPAVPVVTLLATPEEADALAIADASATIRLLLRHPLDAEWTERNPVVLSEVLKETSRPSRPAGRISSSPPAQRAGGAVETAAAVDARR